MKTWFDNNRIGMFNEACNNMLRAEICGGLSVDEMNNILETLESFNNRDMVDKGEVVLIENHKIDLGEELAHAIMSEVVSVEDDKFITELRKNVVKTITLEFEKTQAIYIGDQLRCLKTTITDSYNTLGHGKRFIACPPCEVSLLQSDPMWIYKSATKDTFKGPNNSMLIGQLTIMGIKEEIPIYSYIPLHSVDSNFDNGEYIVGIYDYDTEKCITNTIIYKNITFS